MNRRWLTGHLPDPAEIRRRLGLVGGNGQGVRGWLARTLRDPALWCPTRRSVAGGVATGLFVSWMPIPLQMGVAAVLASLLRVHVPVSVVMVWFTNPLTAGPLLYAAWRTGSNLLGDPVQTVSSAAAQASSAPVTPAQAASALAAGPPAGDLGALLVSLGHAWPAVLVGCLFWGATCAVTGFVATRVLWRVAAVRRWRNRRRASADATPRAAPPRPGPPRP